MHHTHSHQRPHPRGVILLEAIVAIGVLIAVIGAVLGLTLRSSGATRTATDQVVATYLAQDVAEWLVAKKRYNTIGQNYWDGITGTNVGIFTDAPLTTGLSACGTCQLYRTSSGRYTHTASGNAPTPFSRAVTTAEREYDGDATNGPEAVEYTITVSWNTGSRTESFKMHTTLYK